MTLPLGRLKSGCEVSRVLSIIVGNVLPKRDAPVLHLVKTAQVELIVDKAFGRRPRREVILGEKVRAYGVHLYCLLETQNADEFLGDLEPAGLAFAYHV